MRRGEEVVEKGERGMGKEKNRVKNRKEGKRKKGERERQKEEGGTGKRGKEEKRKRGKGEKERFQPAGRGRRQHVQHQPLRCGTQRSKCAGVKGRDEAGDHTTLALPGVRALAAGCQGHTVGSASTVTRGQGYPH